MKINTPEFNEILSVFLKSTDQKEKTISMILETIVPQLNSKNTFVDFGCGDGKITNEIGKAFQETIGIEINKNLTEAFQNKSAPDKSLIFNAGIEDFQLDTEVDLMLFSYVVGYLDKFRDKLKNANYKFNIIQKHLSYLSPNGIALIVDSTYDSKNYRDLFEFMGIPIFDNLKLFGELIKANYNVTEKTFPVNIICSSLTDLVVCFRLITYDTGMINSKKIEMYKQFGRRFQVDNKYVFEYNSKLTQIKK